MSFFELVNDSNIIRYLKTIQEIVYSFNKYNEKKTMKIFGGFIRDIINGVDYNDIDIYFDNYIFSKNLILRIASSIKEKFTEFEEIKDINIYAYTHDSVIRDLYGNIKMEVILQDDKIIKFDISTTVNFNKNVIFNMICDYSINNLYVDFNGENDNPFSELKLRITENTPSIEETIIHIKNKLLVPIFRIEKLAEIIYNNYYNEEYKCRDKLELINLFLERSMTLLIERTEKRIKSDYTHINEDINFKEIEQEVKNLVFNKYNLGLE